MGRRKITIGDGLATPEGDNQVLHTVLLVQEGTSTGNYEFAFTDGSIEYYARDIKQSFEYVLVDNIGNGQVRVAFNKKGIDLTNPINGAKTLRAGDSLYIEDSIKHITLYFLESSIVEFVLMTK